MKPPKSTTIQGRVLTVLQDNDEVEQSFLAETLNLDNVQVETAVTFLRQRGYKIEKTRRYIESNDTSGSYRLIPSTWFVGMRYESEGKAQEVAKILKQVFNDVIIRKE